MNFVLQPWHIWVLAVSAWVNREQAQAIDYLMAENRVLREKLGKGRILLNDDQRRRLAIKGKVLGRKALSGLTTIVTPDTIMRWHRELIAMKWDYSHLRKSTIGRPRLREKIVLLIVRMAKENTSWGYDRIQGALKNMGYRISDTTVSNVLKDHGIEPAPNRDKHTSWKDFLKAHWDVMGATDFTTVEVWSPWGLETYYILVVMKLSTRRIEIAGITTNPDGVWMKQMGRNLLDSYDGFLLDIHYLILDRDTKFQPFSDQLKGSDTKVVLLPPRSLNLNAYMERYMRSMKSECLNKFIFFGEKSLRRAVKEFTEHYHFERNHQGIDNNIIEPSDEVGCTNGDIQCHERLGGMLKYYYRDAA